jgi:hypothetical protein
MIRYARCCMVMLVLAWIGTVVPRTVGFVGTTTADGKRMLLMSMRSIKQVHPFYAGGDIQALKKVITLQTAGLLDAEKLGEPVLTGKKTGLSFVFFEVPLFSLQELSDRIAQQGKERGRTFAWVTADDLQNGRVAYGAQGQTAGIFKRLMVPEAHQWLTGKK